MKRFTQFLSESNALLAWIDVPSLYGELRLAGIHAGNRQSPDPFRVSRGMIGIRTALQRVEEVLRRHGLLIKEVDSVARDGSTITTQCGLYQTIDEHKCIGNLYLIAQLSPIDKNTATFRAYFEVSGFRDESPIQTNLYAKTTDIAF